MGVVLEELWEGKEVSSFEYIVIVLFIYGDLKVRGVYFCFCCKRFIRRENIC